MPTERERKALREEQRARAAEQEEARVNKDVANSTKEFDKNIESEPRKVIRPAPPKPAPEDGEELIDAPDVELMEDGE